MGTQGEYPLQFFSLKILCSYFFLERGERREKEERNINVWLPLMCPLLGTEPATKACALTGNRTSDLSANPLRHTSQRSQGPQFLSPSLLKAGSLLYHPISHIPVTPHSSSRLLPGGGQSGSCMGDSHTQCLQLHPLACASR